jgi:hypothetical protein
MQRVADRAAQAIPTRPVSPTVTGRAGSRLARSGGDEDVLEADRPEVPGQGLAQRVG